jgi:hypothetical protein
VPVYQGKVDVANASTGSTQVLAAVDGYISTRTITPPATSTGRYVRNISSASGKFGDHTAAGQGCTDAEAGSSLVLLDIGAQLNNKTGVALTVVDTQVTYAALVTAIDGYLTSFAGCHGTATIALGTNNGGDFAAYTAAARGKDWADKVVDAVDPHSGITIAGANDIEGAFSSTEAQAEQWESAFIANTPANLLFNGSADGCSSTYGATRGTCEFGWTQGQYYTLAGGRNPTRIQALPQIYFAYQATQWANIDATGGVHLTFAGSLSEHAAACGADCAMTPASAWTTLNLGLAPVIATPRLPAAVDLTVSG